MLNCRKVHITRETLTFGYVTALIFVLQYRDVSFGKRTVWFSGAYLWGAEGISAPPPKFQKKVLSRVQI